MAQSVWSPDVCLMLFDFCGVVLIHVNNHQEMMVHACEFRKYGSGTRLPLPLARGHSQPLAPPPSVRFHSASVSGLVFDSWFRAKLGRVAGGAAHAL
jgi:hypothetical protein